LASRIFSAFKKFIEANCLKNELMSQYLGRKVIPTLRGQSSDRWFRSASAIRESRGKPGDAMLHLLFVESSGDRRPSRTIAAPT
jgi:hypothetical protein